MTLKQRLEERTKDEDAGGGVCRLRKHQQQKLVKTVIGCSRQQGGSCGQSEEVRGDEIREVEGALLGLYCLQM